MTERLHPFYPIVPDAGWLARLVPLGVKFVQLRIKDASAADIRRQVREGLALCRAHGCTLVVNDHWEVAIAEGADWVHLGQEDLEGADLAAIRGAGIRLGVSTHSHAELERGLAARPDYVALGPVFETTLKKMPWAPQGLARVREWAGRIAPLPLVAIGGITLERAGAVIDAGATCLAVVTDVVFHAEPEERTRAWLDWAAHLGSSSRQGELDP